MVWSASECIAIRTRHGVSQEAFARAYGMNTKTVLRAENKGLNGTRRGKAWDAYDDAQKRLEDGRGLPQGDRERRADVIQEINSALTDLGLNDLKLVREQAKRQQARNLAERYKSEVLNVLIEDGLDAQALRDHIQATNAGSNNKKKADTAEES